MNKKLRATLYVLSFAAGICVTAGVGFSRTIQAGADTQTRTLLFPDTYEEYLPLQSPVDVAVSENYKAIADDNVIYLYDVDNGIYQAYEHAVSTLDETKNTITKLQFDKAQNLYFLDASTTLYRLDKTHFTNFGAATVIDTGLVCSTFVIEDDMLYFTNVTTKTQISKAPLSNLDKQHVELLQDNLTSKPTLALWNGDLYFTNFAQVIYKINPDGTLPTPTPVGVFPSELVSITIHSNTFACTDINGNFYAYDLSVLEGSINPNELPTLCYEEGGFSSLTPFGEYIYAIQNNAVKRYDVATQSFDERYAVCSNAEDVNRLNGAAETVFVDGMLYIADNGNNRISVYDTVQKTYNQPIATTLSPVYLASSNQTLLVANDSGLELYSLAENNYGSILFSYTNSADSLTGVAHVYGKYYCSTKNNRYFTIEQKISEETNQPIWTIVRDVSKTYTRKTEALTADAYGQLYTLYATSVYRFSETEFLDYSNQTGVKIIDDLPIGTKRIAVDYERNVYALTDTKVYVCKRQWTDSLEEKYLPAKELTLTHGDVYAKDGHSPTLTSFAFGIEENTAYLLYDGNYIVASTELDLPTVKNIPVGDVAEQIFSAETAEFTLLKTNKHALFVEFDVNVLKDKETFPYLSYQRMNEEYTVLKLGSTADYHLVALFNLQTHRYNTYLVLTTACTPISANEYQIVYDSEHQTSAWLTNDLSLYKFPYLNPLLTACSLPRNTKVTLLGEIGGLDHEYYQVSYEQDGETKIGFIPKTYALPYDPLSQISERDEIGKSNSDVDAIWRFAYIALGLGAIAILVDFLILRKREDDER